MYNPLPSTRLPSPQVTCYVWSLWICYCDLEWLYSRPLSDGVDVCRCVNLLNMSPHPLPPLVLIFFFCKRRRAHSRWGATNVYYYFYCYYEYGHRNTFWYFLQFSCHSKWFSLLIYALLNECRNWFNESIPNYSTVDLTLKQYPFQHTFIKETVRTTKARK